MSDRISSHGMALHRFKHCIQQGVGQGLEHEENQLSRRVIAVNQYQVESYAEACTFVRTSAGIDLYHIVPLTWKRKKEKSPTEETNKTSEIIPYVP